MITVPVRRERQQVRAEFGCVGGHGMARRSCMVVSGKRG